MRLTKPACLRPSGTRALGGTSGRFRGNVSVSYEAPKTRSAACECASPAGSATIGPVSYDFAVVTPEFAGASDPTALAAAVAVFEQEKRPTRIGACETSSLILK